ncbi:SDR family NAD(P)-dependent oxidoreductase [Aerococcus urinaeequi]|uniref:SDR family NAD(P)-dependent oxidoreductase n=1 Tax=Aerococcus urinaeequi TaxID=51665 RepID=UPI003D6C58F5
MLADLGAKVYAVGLDADQMNVPSTLDIHPVELNVADEEKVASFFESLDQLDILINGAAASFPNEYDFGEFKKVMDINANAVFHFCTLAHPLLVQSDIASIINISSLNSVLLQT